MLSIIFLFYLLVFFLFIICIYIYIYIYTKKRKYPVSGRKCLVDVRGQRRMGRLVRDDRKATVTQISTRYNRGVPNTISAEVESNELHLLALL